MRMRRILPLFALMVLAWAPVTLAQASNMGVVVKQGDRGPLGGNFTVVTQPSLNNKGDVVFLGSESKVGIFVKARGGATRAAFTTDTRIPLPGRIALLNFPKINDNGDIVFSVGISQGVARGAILTVSASGTVTKVVAEGDATPAGGAFNEFLALADAFDINNKGDIVLLAPVKDSASTAGIFLFTGGQLVKVAAEGEPLPGIGRASIAGSVPAINNNGDVIFGATDLDVPSGSAIYIFADGQVRRIVGSGDAAPEGGTFSFVRTQGPVFNDQRQFAFLGIVSGRMSVYIASPNDGGIRRVVAIGDTAPDGSTFNFLAASLVPVNNGLNNSGHLLFRANTQMTTEGLFLLADGMLRKIVGQREPAPLGGIFGIDTIPFSSSYSGTKLSDDDLVVFESIIAAGGGSRRAIILWSPQARTSPVISDAGFAKKRLFITASSIDSDIQIEINGQPVTLPFEVVATGRIEVGGSRKKLNLNKGKGKNQVVLIVGGLRSQPFTF